MDKTLIESPFGLDLNPPIIYHAMTRDQIVGGFFFVLFLFVLYQLLLILSPFFQAVFWAGILAFFFHPLYKAILKLVKDNQTLASVITTLIVLTIVIPIVGSLIYSAITEGVKLYDLASQTFTVENMKAALVEIQKIEPIHTLLKQVIESEDLQKNISEYILNIAKPVGKYASHLLTSATKNILVIAIHLLLIIFLLFFLFLDGEKWLNAIKEVLPMEKKHRNTLFEKISETLSAVIRGQLLTAIIQGTIAGLMFWILGLPIPVFFGFLTFLSAMIPVTGAATIWVPFVIYLFSIHETGKAVALLLVGTFIISLLDNILKPLLIGGKTKLPILLLFFGILGGLKLYGLTGIFMGPVILALAFALIKIYQIEYMGVKR